MAAEFPSRVPVPVRRALEVASAVAHDRLLEEHRLCALELLERAEQELPIDRVVGMYLRLHHLDDADALLLEQRLLLTAGRHRRVNDIVVGASGDDEAGSLLDTPRGLLDNVRRRLKGRVHAELRHWVELHTGRTEMRLLRLHCEEALGFVRTLDGILTSGSAVELYQRRLRVRSSLHEVLYLMVLDRLGAEATAIFDGSAAVEEPFAVQRAGRGGTSPDRSSERPLIAAVRSRRPRRQDSDGPSTGASNKEDAAAVG